MKKTLFLAIICSLLSCSKKEEAQSSSSTTVSLPAEISKELQVTESSTISKLSGSEDSSVSEREKASFWGIPFSYEEVQLSSDEAKKRSKAIAYIRGIDRSEATGFFVSPDGLFITNYHVINDEKCQAKVCHGYKIIRDFSVQGEIEVFNNFEIVALNKELDYTLLKVDLSGKEVPYLVLNDQNNLNIEDQVSIQGHPFGAPQKVSKAILSSVNDSILKLKSNAISGNSGSPIINNKTSKVEGVYFEGFWDKSIVSTAGEAQHYSTALNSYALLKNLQFLFPNVVVRESGLILGSRKESNVLMDNEADSEVNSFSKFFHSSIGEQTDWALFKNLFDEVVAKYKSATTTLFLNDLKSFVDNFSRLNRLATKINLSEEAQESLKEIFSYEDQDKYNNDLYPLLVSIDEEKEDECIEVVLKRTKDSTVKERLHRIHSLSSICLAQQAEEGEDLLNEIVEEVESFKAEDESLVLSLILNQVERQSEMTEEKLESTKSALKNAFVEKTKSLKMKFIAENLILMLRDESTRVQALKNWLFL